MSLTGRLRDKTRRGGDSLDADTLIHRVNALDRFTKAAEPYLPADAVRPAKAVVERAGGRLALSRDHTVVALAGPTGSGKSSLFNAMSGMELSSVGVRRPTTGITHACVWRAEGTGGLLDWLGIPPDRRFVRESALDGDDEAGLRGLVLLDLPDFDSVQAAHRLEVDRLLRLVDLIVWVTDPQKYADQVIHEQYLRTFHRHTGNTVVVLNQADRLSEADTARCLADLHGLLAADGFGDIPVFGVSAVGARPGTGPLRQMLHGAVTERQASLWRLNADVDGAVESITPLVGPPVAEDTIDRATGRELTGALAASAGVPAVTQAADQAYRFRAGKSMGWPLSRWVRHVRSDPLRRLRLGQNAKPALDTSSIPAPDDAQRASADLAIRAVSARAGAGLPVPWQAAVAAAAHKRIDDLPDALDQAIVHTDLGMDRKPFWWRVAGVLQWLVTIGALAAAGWLLLRLILIALGVATIGQPARDVGPVHVPIATLVLVCGVLAGILLSLLVKPLISAGARRAGNRAGTRLHAAVGEVSRDYVIAPVHAVLHDYAEARAAAGEAANR